MSDNRFLLRYSLARKLQTGCTAILGVLLAAQALSLLSARQILAQSANPALSNVNVEAHKPLVVGEPIERELKSGESQPAS